MTPIKNQSCPLCSSQHYDHFHQDQDRDYLSCQQCSLIFVSPAQFLSLEEEKARYDQHQNSPFDQEYRKFLNHLCIPLAKELLPQSVGLDFGSGPGPTLSKMFEEKGHVMDIYDCFYANDREVFNRQYDFISMSEVIEQLHNPKKELERLWGCLKMNGKLGIMTNFVKDRRDFTTWHYKSEETHVCFFSKKTFEWLASFWNTQANFAGENVVIFNKDIK